MEYILVFGGTGETGKEIIKQALTKGFAVIAIVRDPTSWSMKHPLLTICKGDVLQPSTFENEMTGKDAVISCLGTGRNLKPTTVYSRGMENIIRAMNNADVKRIVCLSAVALYTNSEMGFFIKMLAKLVVQKILKNLFADMRLMEKKLQATTLNYSIVRPPMLNNKPLSGHYRTAVNTHLKHPFSISRADLAHYMLSILKEADTYNSILEIAH
jgi:putative NADH-flavin reductase